MGKKDDLNDFECDMIVCGRQAGLSISETARTTVSRVYRVLGLGTETRYQYGTGTYVTGMYRTESERRFRCLISVPTIG